MKLTILYGTETGNCRDLAEKVAKKGAKNGVEAEIVDLAVYSAEKLLEIDNPMLLIISTWDDGAPPPDCTDFYEELMASRADLRELDFAVLALGDTEYPQFCECGKQIDARLEKLGAKRILERTDLDADFLVSYMGWSKKFWQTMAERFSLAA